MYWTPNNTNDMSLLHHNYPNLCVVVSLLFMQIMKIPFFNRCQAGSSGGDGNKTLCVLWMALGCSVCPPVSQTVHWLLCCIKHHTANILFGKQPAHVNAKADCLANTPVNTLGDRTFPVAASRTWNSLPTSVRDIQSLPAFRQKLKLTLFSDSFASWI